MNTKLPNTFAFAIILLLLIPAATIAQKITSLAATAKGQGTITVENSSTMKIYAVRVALKEGGEAEFTLYTDLQLAAQGRWSVGDDLSKGIDLEVTGGIVSGNASGTGKLFLLGDGKSIDKLTVEAKTADGSKVTVEFVAAKE